MTLARHCLLGNSLWRWKPRRRYLSFAYSYQKSASLCSEMTGGLPSVPGTQLERTRSGLSSAPQNTPNPLMWPVLPDRGARSLLGPTEASVAASREQGLNTKKWGSNSRNRSYQARANGRDIRAQANSTSLSSPSVTAWSTSTPRPRRCSPRGPCTLWLQTVFVLRQHFSFQGDGEQSLSPQNMPVLDIGYFKLVIFKK